MHRPPSSDTPIAILERWEQCGGTWRVRSTSAAAAAIDLCTCHGDLVEQLASADPAFVRLVAERCASVAQRLPNGGS